jgi:hypothetical protein
VGAEKKLHLNFYADFKAKLFLDLRPPPPSQKQRLKIQHGGSKRRKIVHLKLTGGSNDLRNLRQ